MSNHARQQARIVELEAALVAALAQISGLEAEKETLAAQLLTVAVENKGTESKSKKQAREALALLEKGPVTLAMLKAINEKYPSDPIYFARTILGIKNITTTRGKGKETVYSLAVTAPVVEQAPSTDATPAPEVTNPEPVADVVVPEQPAAPVVEEQVAVPVAEVEAAQ